jgi:asparagine synthase (glutamine-hydrolysing)
MLGVQRQGDMCGICGVFNQGQLNPTRAETLADMVGALDHRGPDESGGYLDDQVALGQSRLSIIDLSGGAQPMANENGEIWLVFNGEIFNYVELAEELKKAGHVFATQSDTEVIIHAYEEWGCDCVERFNGQFAFGIWDKPLDRLFLARDRVGIRPLYYTTVENRFLFASEIKSIFADPSISRELDAQGLAQVFSLWATVAPTTPFKGIRQVRPGHCLIVEKGSPPREYRYWRPDFPDAEPTQYTGEKKLDQLAEELREKLEASTKLRMLRADVPVGVYLSGGIDSSVIGALVRRFHHGHLRTFSLSFKHPDFDERNYQNEMVERLGTDHSVVQVDYHDIAEAFYDVIGYTESPILRTAPAPLYLLSKLVRQNDYKVVLTGEGSDEFLAGYDIFREDRVRRFWAKHRDSEFRPQLLNCLYPWLSRSPAQAKALQRSFFGKGMDRQSAAYFSHIPRWEAAASLQRLFHEDFRARINDYDAGIEFAKGLPSEIDGWDPLGKAQFVEISTLLSGYLLSSQGDRMLMGNSVEGRFPFLDHNVMEFANALPPDAKLRVLDEKHLLKRAAADLIPSSILQRPKQPYRAPDAQCFVQEDVPDWVEEVVSAEAVADAGVFVPIGVERLLKKCRKHRDRTPSNADNMAVLGVISTQLLHHLFVRGAGRQYKRAEFNHWFDRRKA